MRAAWSILAALAAVACGATAGGGSPDGAGPVEVRELPDAGADAADGRWDGAPFEAADPAPEGIEPRAEGAEATAEAVEPSPEAIEPVPEVAEPVPEVAEPAPDGDARDAAEAADAPAELEGFDDAAEPSPEASPEVDACGADVACPACAVDADCDDGAPCTADACLDGACAHEVTGTCCDGACASAGPCATSACVDGLCVQAWTADVACCADGPLPDATWSFEAGLPAGAVVEVPSGAVTTWTTSTVAATAGARSLWFGDPASGTYQNLAGPAGQPQVAVGTVTLPPVTLPAAGVVVAAFDLRLDTEWNTFSAVAWEIPGPQMGYDQLTVLANGTPVWSSLLYDVAGSTCRWGSCTFVPLEVSLAAFAGQEVALGFRFDSRTVVDNAHAGPFIDHLRLQRSCAPIECFSSIECDDPDDPLDVCTRDTCEGRQCVFARTYAAGASCCMAVDQTTLVFEGYDQAAFSIEGQGPVTWQVTTTAAGGRAHTGQGSLYLGDPATHTCVDPGGAPVTAMARWAFTVPPFEGYDLAWWQWLDLAGAADPVRDAFTVTIRATDASDEGQVVFTNKPLYGYPAAWRHLVTSLDPWQDRAVEVVFAFDSGAQPSEGGEGIYLDEVTTYYGCH